MDSWRRLDRPPKGKYRLFTVVAAFLFGALAVFQLFKYYGPEPPEPIPEIDRATIELARKTINRKAMCYVVQRALTVHELCSMGMNCIYTQDDLLEYYELQDSEDKYCPAVITLPPLIIRPKEGTGT